MTARVELILGRLFDDLDSVNERINASKQKSALLNWGSGCSKHSQEIVVSIMAKAKKIIQVPIEDDLLGRIDATAGVVAESRAAFIREACKQRLRSLRTKELDRLYSDEARRGLVG
jgi:hypothetical protein